MLYSIGQADRGEAGWVRDARVAGLPWLVFRGVIRVAALFSVPLLLLDQMAVRQASIICLVSHPLVVFCIMYAFILLCSDSHCTVQATLWVEEGQCDRPAIACPKPLSGFVERLEARVGGGGGDEGVFMVHFQLVVSGIF